MTSDRAKFLALALLMLAAVFGVYQPAWTAGFLWDDDALIIENPFVRSADGLSALWFHPEQQLEYYPVTHTLSWLQFRAWGANPVGYHLLNLLLHGLGAILVWLVLATLKIRGAFVAAMIFALHPVGAASVAWVAESKNTLSLVFAAASMLSLLRFDLSRRPTAFALSLAFFALALLSKASVVTLPVVMLASLWWRHGTLKLRQLTLLCPHLLLAVATGAMALIVQHEQALGSMTVRPEGLASRTAVAGQALWFYVGKLLLPVNLAAVYPRWEVSGMTVSDHAPLLAWLLVGLLAGALCWSARSQPAARGIGRAIVLAWLSCTALLGPVLGLITMAHHKLSFVADHFQYLSMIPVIALAVAGVASLLSGQGVLVTRLRVLSATVLLCALAGLTWQRATVYRTRDSLSRDILSLHDSWFAHYHLAIAALDRDEPQAAAQHLRRSAELAPLAAEPRSTLGNLLAMGRDYAAAEPLLRRAIELFPEEPMAHVNLADVLLATGRSAESRAELDLVLGIAPAHPGAREMLGRWQLATGSPGSAEQTLSALIAARPANVNAHNLLGIALVNLQRHSEAEAVFEAALAQDPDHPELLNNLGRLLSDKGERDRAESLFLAALRARPGYARARENLEALRER